MTVEECFDQVINEEVPTNKGTFHEWATVKAYLLEAPRIEAVSTYQEFFRVENLPNPKAPKWLITLACMWKALEMGHKRQKKLFSGLEKQCLYLLAKLDENALQLNKNLRSHIKSGNADILS